MKKRVALMLLLLIGCSQSSEKKKYSDCLEVHALFGNKEEVTSDINIYNQNSRYSSPNGTRSIGYGSNIYCINKKCTVNFWWKECKKTKEGK